MSRDCAILFTALLWLAPYPTVSRSNRNDMALELVCLLEVRSQSIIHFVSQFVVLEVKGARHKAATVGGQRKKTQGRRARVTLANLGDLRSTRASGRVCPNAQKGFGHVSMKGRSAIRQE